MSIPLTRSIFAFRVKLFAFKSLSGKVDLASFDGLRLQGNELYRFVHVFARRAVIGRFIVSVYFVQRISLCCC